VCDTGYSVKRLVEDLREIAGLGAPEPEMLEAVRGKVKQLMMMKHNWLRSSMTATDSYLLHEEPDHSLAVFVFTAKPGEEAEPHDHGTWVVIGGLEGWQTQHRWTRVNGELVREGTERIDARAIVALGSGEIHSLENDSGANAVTLNVYGMHPDYT
jgi:predicted metal-dependent enzyme (double-stranded beta helix superfamily)